MSFTTAAWTYPSPTNTTPTIASTAIASPSASPPDTSAFLNHLHHQSMQVQHQAAMTTAPSPTNTAAAAAGPSANSTSPNSNNGSKKKRPSMTLNTTELSREDDWTKVKDPKEKKRIQNRVAQRTYRHRMKARLGELQARLDSHERRRLQQATPDNSDTATSNGIVPPYTSTPANMHHAPGSSCAGDDSSPSPMANASTPTAQMSMMQPGIYDHQPTDGSENAMFQQPSRLLNSPPQSHPSPGEHGLLSPPGQPGSERGAKVPQDFVLDCLRFQTQLLNRLNNLQQDPNYPHPYPGADGVPPMLDGMTQAEQVHCVNAFTPTNQEAMEFAFDASVDMWKTDAAMTEKMRSSSASTADVVNFPSLAGATPTGASMGPSMMEPHPGMGPDPSHMGGCKSSTLDDRFEGIMEHVQAAGFDSFDDLVTAYYNGTFGDASPLANEQRLSRNRRLPRVIGDVFEAAEQWTAWERRGFHEEILKTAESMLTSEGTGARPALLSKIGPLIESQDGVNPIATAEALLAVKRAIQNELPNSWALTMALAADSRNSWQRDRSNTALATTLLLNFSGRIPNDQLLRLLGTCL